MTRVYKKIIKYIFIIIIILLYILFLYLDIYNKNIFISTNIIKFISILLCFFLSLLNNIYRDNLFGNTLLSLGLFFTVIADYIFLVLNRYYFLAIILFSIVQILYILRYNSKNYKRNFFYIVISFILILTAYYFLNKFMVNLDLIFPLGLFYSICILISLKEAIIQYKDKIYLSPNRELILLGMVLFVLCDINVALYNTLYPNNKIVFILIWLFYLPSQLLLALSGK